MSIFFRRSFRSGPIRLNLSGHGMGVSVGVPGFRVGVNARGRHYLQAGVGGVYYRANLDGGAGQQAPRSLPEQSPQSQGDLRSDVTSYTSAPAAGFATSHRQDLIAQLTEAEQSIPWLLIAGITAVVLGVGLCAISVIAGMITAILGIGFSAWAHRQEKTSRLVTLEYQLSSEQKASFTQLVDGFNHLAACSAVWAVDTDRRLSTDHDRKLNGGAGSLVERHTAHVGESCPQYLVTNVPIPCIQSGSTAIYFFPDFILVHDPSGTGHGSYKELTVECGESRFIEETAPADAKVVDRTWRFPNKHGGPDKRFANNAEIPVCLYGTMKILMQHRHVLLLETSQVAASAFVSKSIQEVAKVEQAHHQQSQNPLRAEVGPNSKQRTPASHPTIQLPATIGPLDEAELLRQVEEEEKERERVFDRTIHAKTKP